MKPTFSLLVIALLFTVPGTAMAQASHMRPAPSPLFRAAPPQGASADTLNLPKTYAKEGALIGGIPMLVIGGVVGRGLCGMDESSDPPNCALAAVGGALVGATIGAITGALIGGSIERE